MVPNPRSASAAGLGALFFGLFQLLGNDPISWPRAAVLIVACLAIAAIGLFSHGPAPAPVAPAISHDDVRELVARMVDTANAQRATPLSQVESDAVKAVLCESCERAAKVNP